MKVGRQGAMRTVIGAGLVVAATLSVLAVVASLTGEVNTPSETADPSPAPHTAQTKSAVGWSPEKACAFARTAGLITGTYKEIVGSYTCLSPYKDLGGSGVLPNNLAYYVEGDRNIAHELKLFLNVNDRTSAGVAYVSLEQVARTLTFESTGMSIPDDVAAARRKGVSGAWSLEGHALELKRDEWPTGKGYELHYTIKKTR